MVFPSPGHHSPESPKQPAPELKLVRVLVPVYMAVYVRAEDTLQAECLAIESLRKMRITGCVGAAEKLAMHSIISPLCPEES